MTAGDEYRDWKAGVMFGRAAWLAGQPRPQVNELDPFQRGTGVGWDHAASHEAERREDWRLLANTECAPKDTPKGVGL